MYPSIIIDTHEFNTKNSFGHLLYNFIEENKVKKGSDYEIKLKGDHYIRFSSVNILNLNNIGDIVCGNTVFEIKNEDYSKDYTISMHSGHLDEQLDDMFEKEEFENSPFTYKYLFVLGNIKDNDFYFTKLQSKHIIGRSFDNAEHMIYWILYTCYYNNSPITPHIAFDVPRYRPAWSFLKNVPGVGRKTAENIIKQLHYVHTLEDVMNLTTEELTSVNGVGNITAEIIQRYIHNEKPVSEIYGILDDLSNPNIRESEWNKLKSEGGL